MSFFCYHGGQAPCYHPFLSFAWYHGSNCLYCCCSLLSYWYHGGHMPSLLSFTIILLISWWSADVSSNSSDLDLQWAVLISHVFMRCYRSLWSFVVIIHSYHLLFSFCYYLALPFYCYYSLLSFVVTILLFLSIVILCCYHSFIMIHRYHLLLSLYSCQSSISLVVSSSLSFAVTI